MLVYHASDGPSTNVPVEFFFQATDPATNAVIGTPDLGMDIPAGGSQSFVFAVTTNAAFAPVELELSFDCRNSDPAVALEAINTLLISASGSPVPDVVALGATLNNDGIVNLTGPAGAGAFPVATVNLGASATEIQLGFLLRQRRGRREYNRPEQLFLVRIDDAGTRYRGTGRDPHGRRNFHCPGRNRNRRILRGQRQRRHGGHDIGVCRHGWRRLARIGCGVRDQSRQRHLPAGPRSGRREPDGAQWQRHIQLLRPGQWQCYL